MSTAIGAERKRIGVKLLTPEGAVFDGLAYVVVAPSIEGEVGIYPRHQPLVCFLKPGETRLKMLDDTEQAFATTDGYMSVGEDQVLILVEQAEPADGIDQARAEESLRQAEEDLAAAGDDEAARTAAEGARRRAQNRLKVVESRK